MIIALTTSVEEDLLPLAALLHQRGIAHRVFELDGEQVIQVSTEADADQVRGFYRAWREGELRIELRKVKRPSSDLRSSALAFPVIIGLIVASCVGFVVASLLPDRSWAQALTFLPFQAGPEGLKFFDMQGQYWRLLTPAFLHFGWLHVTFNCLWLWELGRRVERVMGSFNMLLLFVVIAVVSNVSQFQFERTVLFGGMSGVVYGLLGFSWVAPWFQPRWQIQPPGAVVVFMLVWLLACATGLVTMITGIGVANAAHVSGLLCGAALGAVFGLFSAKSTR